MLGSQSLERGIALLEMIDAEVEPLGVREIARRLELSPTIVQRLINTLMKLDYVEQVAETRRYRIGSRAFALGKSFTGSEQLLAAAKEELRRLAVQHELNGFLGVLDNGKAVYALAEQSRGPISITAAPGQAMPLHSTAIGKILLASLDNAAALSILGRAPLPKLTPKTVTDRQLLLKQVGQARKNDFVVVQEENLPGVISIGAPIRDRSESIVAALSVSFARSISPELAVSKVLKLTIDAAKRISLQIGCPASALTRLRRVA